MNKRFFSLIILIILLVAFSNTSLATTGNPTNAQDLTAPADYSGSITSQQTILSLEQGSGGPILVIANPSNPMSYYFAEILRAEGLNEFAVLDISTVTPSVLATYDIAILGEMSLSSEQVSMITNWVDSGGNLVAMRPDKQLASLLGIVDASATISESYLLINTTFGPGVGIVSETMQFHGTTDLYTTGSAIPIAEIYSDASTPTGYPAITINNVGQNGGKAAAFAFDLARSLVYTRQGNPEWAYQHRNPWKTHYVALDLFYPDWIDFNKIDIPQADEQQRLLANMILQMNISKKPLPRFWYFPKGEKAVVIMTGDDHTGYQGKTYSGNTTSFFGIMNSKSPINCSVENWECVRASSYLYVESPMTNAEAISFTNQGFELGLHVDSAHTSALWCASWTADTLVSDYQSQMSSFYTKYQGIPVQVSERSHCYAWYGYTDQPVVENTWGIRLDTNIPYWPEQWVQYRPGFMIGTVMPMRFVDLNDNMIDVYNAATIITDDNGEFGQPLPYTIDTLLDWAVGREGYYGAFTINMHSDNYYNFSYNGARKIIDSALARDVPVVSGEQMVEWLDGRNSSAYQTISWNPPHLTFEIIPGAGAIGLQGMIPIVSSVDRLTEITRDGVPLPFTPKTIKGIEYAFFDALSGTYTASYTGDFTPPAVISTVPANNSLDVAVKTSVIANFNEAISPSTVNASTFRLVDSANNPVNANVYFDPVTNSAVLEPLVPLLNSTTYAATAAGGVNGITDMAGNPLPNDVSWSFTTIDLYVCPCSIWDNSTPSSSRYSNPNPIEVGVKFRADVDGTVTGVRFYKDSLNTGTHVAHLWDRVGTLLAEATFVNETSSGWQSVNFANPIQISANTTYIVSYLTPRYFSRTRYFFLTSGYDNLPLHALAEGVDGSNGVFKQYGGFPDQSTMSTNYWVDVIFDTFTPPDTTPPVVVSTSPTNGSTGIDLDANVTAIFSEALLPYTVNDITFRLVDPSGNSINAVVSFDETTFTATLNPLTSLDYGTTYIATLKGGANGITDLAGNPMSADYSWSFTTVELPPPDTTPPVVLSADPTNGLTEVDPNANMTAAFSEALLPSTVNTTNFQLFDPAGNPVPAGVSYDEATFTATLNPNASLAYEATYTANLKGGANGITDLAGNPLASDYSWSFTTQSPYTCPCSIWSLSDGTTRRYRNPNPIEVGLKFRAEVDGYILGVRFFKHRLNTGTHIAHLWTNDGTQLAEAIFTNETPSGWQSVMFDNPVPITANTTYIVSYLTEKYYSFERYYFSTEGVDNPPLHALADGVDGPNGVYKEFGGFPDQTHQSYNYWVDIIFDTTLLSPSSMSTVYLINIFKE